MTKTNIKTNLKSLKQILFIITLVLILITSGQLILNHNNHNNNTKQSTKQTKLLTNTNTIKTNTYQVIKVYYNDLDKSFYLHTTNLLDAPCAFDVILKDIQGDPNSILEDLNEAFTGSKLSIKYDTKNTIDKYDDEILEYKFIDNTTYKQKGKIQNSLITINNQYLNFIQTEEGELYKVFTHDKLSNNQNVTLEISNDTGAVINLEFN